MARPMPSDDSNFPSAMNLQDLIDMSNAIPEECATSLPVATAQDKIVTNNANLDPIINYDDTLTNKLGALLESTAFSDVIFSIGDEKTEMKAHKLMLSLASPVFKAMFYGEMTSNQISQDPITYGQPATIDVPDCTPRSFKILLQFIYNGVEPSLTVDDAFPLLYTARKYAVRGLEDMCCVVLSSSITADNVFDVLYAATFYNLTALDYQCWEFMEDNPVDVLNSHLEYLTHETLRSILRNEKLNAPEVQLFEILMIWGEKECKKAGVDNSPENIRRLCENELKLIRFPIMSGQEFADVVVPTNVLTVDEVAKVFTTIASSDKKTNSTEFCTTPRIPKVTSKRTDTPRPPVFTFVAEQMRDNSGAISNPLNNDAALVYTQGPGGTITAVLDNAPTAPNANAPIPGRNRQRQSRRSRRRNQFAEISSSSNNF